MYKVLDDVIPEDNLFNLEKIFYEHDRVPWYLNKVVEEKDPYGAKKESIDLDNNFQFVHLLYYNSEPKSEFFKDFFPIFKILDPAAITRAKVNFNIKTEKIVEYGFHIDNSFPHNMTAIFYLNSNNGYTLFENGERVYSKRNRMLIFSSDLFHTGTSCTDSHARIVININYFESKNSPRVLNC